MKYKLFGLILFLSILLISSFLYLYKLNDIPNGFYVDEAAVAYNAYSIQETGKDIFNQPKPVLFRLLGSYTPGLYIYTVVPLIRILGMQPYVFRLISVLSAIVSIIFLFLLVKKLNIYKSPGTQFLIVLLYAISPWMVFNARLGYEVTLAYALFNIGIYFMWSAFKNRQSIFWGILFMSLSTYAAHTQRYMVPIFLVFYFFIFRKNIFRYENKKVLIYSFLTALLSQVPNLLLINTPAFWVKNERLLEQPLEQISGSIINQLFSYLSPRNLFYELSDIDLQHTIPGMSVMYDFLVIPYFIGLYRLYKLRVTAEVKFVALLFAVTLIPAVFSGQFISIQRALPFLLPLILTIGIGIDYILKKIHPYVFIPLWIMFVFYALLMLYRSYFVLFPKERAVAWNYGYDRIAEFIKLNPNYNYMIDNSRNPRNYILILYYLRYPPSLYQSEVDDVYKNDYYRSLPPEDKYKFSNIEVRAIDWSKDTYIDQILIGDSLSISENQAKEHFLTKMFEVKDPLNNILFIAYKTDKTRKCKMDNNPLCLN